MATALRDVLAICRSDEEADRQLLRTIVAEEDVWLHALQVDPNLAAAIVMNKHLPAGVLRVLAENVDPRVRTLVAMKKRADGETLARLANDSDEGVRAMAARNAGMPIDALARLAGDGSSIVREAVADAMSRARR